MKIKPSMKKPQLDLAAEALKFASGTTRAETRHTGSPETEKPGSGEHQTHKETPRKKKAVQGDSNAPGIIVKQAEKGCGTVLAQGSMNIYDAVQLKPALLDALHKHQYLEIDLSEVVEMDTAGVQLLLLLKRTAAQTGKSVSLVAHSPASLDAIDRYNLAAYFGDPVIISSNGA